MWVWSSKDIKSWWKTTTTSSCFEIFRRSKLDYNLTGAIQNLLKVNVHRVLSQLQVQQPHHSDGWYGHYTQTNMLSTWIVIGLLITGSLILHAYVYCRNHRQCQTREDAVTTMTGGGGSQVHYTMPAPRQSPPHRHHQRAIYLGWNVTERCIWQVCCWICMHVCPIALALAWPLPGSGPSCYYM